MYKIEFASSSAKEFRLIEKNVKIRIANQINFLSENPRPTGCKKLQGDENFYRIRIGSYRVIYKIYDETKTIKITRIRHRSKAY